VYQVHDSETCNVNEGQPCEMCVFANAQAARQTASRREHIAQLRHGLIAEIDRMQAEVNRLDAEFDKLEEAEA
jgi:hypothetical protein